MQFAVEVSRRRKYNKSDDNRNSRVFGYADRVAFWLKNVIPGAKIVEQRSENGGVDPSRGNTIKNRKGFVNRREWNG